jgi:hypothetical protein
MHPSHFPAIIHRKLRNLERSLRFYAALDGIAATLGAVFALFWFDFFADRFFEFSQVLRCILFFGLLGILGYCIWIWVIRRCRAAIRPDQLASFLERFVPNLNESLITAVELAGSDHDDTTDETADPIQPILLQRTVHEAAQALRGINVRRFFNHHRLRFRLAFAGLCAGVLTGFLIYSGETSEIWFSRNILLSQRDYPRRSQLIAEGFQDGKVRVGRGDSFTLTVRANTAMPLVPETIRLRLGSKETGYRTTMIDQFRTDTLNGTDWRFFSMTFPELLDSVVLQVRGGDSTLDDLLVEVVPPPILTGVKLQQKFPDYMERPSRTVAASGQATVPDGTDVIISATPNKPLKNAGVIVDRGEVAVLAVEPPINFALPKLRKNTLLEFQLEDHDLLRNRLPIRFDVGITKDQPPVVTARLDGIGSAITPNAVLPTVGEITDDNGLSAAAFRYKTEQEKQSPDNEQDKESEKPKEGTVAISDIGKSQTIFPLEKTFSVAELNVKPGDKLSLSVEASDRFDLDSPPGQVGTGPLWMLEIVTAERLKTLLEVREISLRQRFEVLIGETGRTKTIIDEFSLAPPEKLVRQAEELTALPTTSSENLTNIENDEEYERELAAKRQRMLDTISAEQSASGAYSISRTLRDTQKEVYDLRTIIESFRLIRQEMINNRIFTDDDEHRIDGGILKPMQSLIDADFPDLDRLISEWSSTLENRNEPMRPKGLTQQKEILDQFDSVIKKMISIRDSMVSMESFNEAVEILRAIIKQQQQLRNETIEEKNKRLKNLLE